MNSTPVIHEHAPPTINTIMNFEGLYITVQLDRYNKCIDDNYECYYEGTIIYKDKREGHESILNILRDFSCNKLDWNQIHGAHRIIIVNKIDNTVILFTDNAGLLCFYYHEYECTLSDSFIELLESTKQHNLNFNAVAGIAKDGLIYGDQTICKEIRRLPSECYFIWDGKELKNHPKAWKSFEELEYENSIFDFSRKIFKSISGKKIASIITAGFDSRWVLSMLLAENISSDLFISGDYDLIDVKIARQIAERLNKPLTICSGAILTQKEFNEAFRYSDGQFNCVDLYRLYLLQKSIENKGYDIVMGGVGGEFYKNSFINQDFPVYWGSLDTIKFIKQKVSYDNYNTNYFTDEFAKYLSSVEGSIQDKISTLENSRQKSKQAIEYGYWVLKQRMVTVSNRYLVPQIALLVERDSISFPYKINPYYLEMNMLQRTEITNNAPFLSNILTDRKVTTKSNFLSIVKDLFENYYFLLKVYVKRFYSKKKSNPTSGKHNFNSIIIEDNYRNAFNHCQKAGIFKKDVLFDEVDRSVLDNTLAVGLLISKYFNGFDEDAN